jgi:hypothetical protein
MLPSMSDKKLQADKSFDLKAEISGYEIKRPFTGVSTSKVTTSTRRYQMNDNQSGIRNLLFRFDASGNCYLTFVTAGAIHNIPFGLDTWLHGMTDRTLSVARTVYPNAMGVTPVQTAGICTWTAENQLSAYYLSMFNPGSDETFRFTFDGDDLKMEIIVPAPRRMGPPDMQQPEPGNIILSGTRIRD